MAIEDLDPLTVSGTADFTCFAQGETQEVTAATYAPWGKQAVQLEQARQRLSIPTPNIGVFSFDDATANRFGFVTRADRTFISAKQFGPGFGERHGGFDVPSQGAATDFDCAAPLYRQGDHIYGHWLLDILPRAWLINRLCPDRDVTFLIRQNSPGFARPMLEAMGLPPDRIVSIDTRTAHPRAKEMLMATNLRYNQVVHPAMQLFAKALIKEITDPTARLSAKAIFVSRQEWTARKAQKRQLLNAEEIESFYGDAGYQSVAPETLPFAAQVALFQAASAMAGNEGSGLHNSIFAPAGICVDALTSPNNRSLIQASLCIACGQEINMVCGERDGMGAQSRDASFHLPVETVKARFDSERTPI